VRGSYEEIIGGLQRQLADTKNAFGSLKREMGVNEEEALSKLREEQSARWVVVVVVVVVVVIVG